VAGHRFVPAERVADDPGHLDQLCVGQMGRRRRPVPGVAAVIRNRAGHHCEKPEHRFPPIG
jgi:hypothetical protein